MIRGHGDATQASCGTGDARGETAPLGKPVADDCIGEVEGERGGNAADNTAS